MKKLYLVLMLILSIGFVAAHGIYANMDGGIEMKSYDIDYRYDDDTDFVKKDFTEWNDRGFYSKWDKKGFRNRWDRKDWGKKERYGEWSKEPGKKYYFEYVAHMRSYVKKSCYTSAPADKLFYIKC